MLLGPTCWVCFDTVNWLLLAGVWCCCFNIACVARVSVGFSTRQPISAFCIREKWDESIFVLISPHFSLIQNLEIGCRANNSQRQHPTRCLNCFWPTTSRVFESYRSQLRILSALPKVDTTVKNVCEPSKLQLLKCVFNLFDQCTGKYWTETLIWMFALNSFKCQKQSIIC